ncbi:MAG: vitamin K epoxide reductase family protein [Gaiellaceae bacterium]
MAVLAAAGAGVSAYLLAARGTPVCSTGGCELVQGSRYAHVLRIPVAALGLAAFLTLFATALSRSELARAAGAAIGLAGLLFSIYLLVVQLAVIGAVCEWCVAGDAIAALLAPAAALRIVQ